MPPTSEAAQPQDQVFMQMALQLAADAAAAGEVPVGAVVVRNGVVVGRGRNAPIVSNDPTAHAEVLALREAAQTLANYRLDDCTLYVTLEPCAMCCGSVLNSRVRRVVFGASEPKTGCAGSVLDLFSHARLNHHTQVQGGVLADQASQQLQAFFRARRLQQREHASPLRDDALRAPESRFDALPDWPWASHWITELASLNGLRMHYLDEGPRDAQRVVLCLHPIPGWAYSLRGVLPSLVEQGARVLLPDLIGFGRSDKPKREDFHTLDWHVQCLQEWLVYLQISRLTLRVPSRGHPLAQRLLQQLGPLCDGMDPVAVAPDGDDRTQSRDLDAAYPDTGHRAAERAFASGRVR